MRAVLVLAIAVVCIGLQDSPVCALPPSGVLLPPYQNIKTSKSCDWTRHHHAGRPVDILLMPDGALLVSDDYSGAITRITYQR